MFVKIIYAILMISTGILLLKYRRQVKMWTGNFMWAEQYIGRGGTYLVIIFIAIILIFVGFIYPFGGADLLFNKK